MTDLVDAYQRREVHVAEKILRGMLTSTVNLLVTQEVQTISPRSWMMRLSTPTLESSCAV